MATRSTSSRPRAKAKRIPAPVVFISHAHEDTDLALRLADTLRAKGFETWLDDEELQPGENWAREVGKALESADLIVALLSKNFSRSRYAQRAWEFAIGSKRHAGRVLPVLTPGTSFDAVPWIAKHIQHVKPGADWRRTSERVADDLWNLAGTH